MDRDNMQYNSGKITCFLHSGGNPDIHGNRQNYITN